ncbi:H-NS histone family protein [Candidatus Pantoea formicae]|uniref:H-NS histone family protein n=1 Tax=Candidatus Pantoea formicae TaxID=2608355 RepID=UPI003ED8E31B
MTKKSKEAGVLNTLRDKRKLRDLLADCTFAEIQEIQEKVTSVMDDVIREFESRADKRLKAQQLIKKFQEETDSPELRLSDLLPADNDVLGKRKFAIKYRFRDENNQIKHWSGVGKMPVFLRTYQDNGGDIEDFNIENESE